MDKSQKLLEIEIDQLKSRIEQEPDKVRAIAEQCALRSAQILYPEGEIQCLVIMSRCAWNTMDYRKGLRFIKEAHSKLNALDTDDLLPEILHIHALHYWGQAKYYSAQQFWINALEQSALVDEVEIRRPQNQRRNEHEPFVAWHEFSLSHSGWSPGGFQCAATTPWS